MKFDIKLQTQFNKTFRAEALRSQFDITADSHEIRLTGEIPIEDKQWNIGVIVGNSGSGKSTIAKHLFKDELWSNFSWKEKHLIDDFDSDLRPDDIFSYLSSVGFSSPPLWLNRYDVLSTGQKMRVDLARCISDKNKDKTIVFDEFTSVVDRQVAMVGSLAISKTIRRLNKKFIAVTCHSDVLPWLSPDWVYNVDESRFFFTQKSPDSFDQSWKLPSSSAARRDGIIIRSFTI